VQHLLVAAGNLECLRRHWFSVEELVSHTTSFSPGSVIGHPLSGQLDAPRQVPREDYGAAWLVERAEDWAPLCVYTPSVAKPLGDIRRE
jgi:hypothetical protein